jgi:hypothetical protein
MFHFLLLARDPALTCLNDLRQEQHGVLYNHMLKVAETVATAVQRTGGDVLRTEVTAAENAVAATASDGGAAPPPLQLLPHPTSTRVRFVRGFHAQPSLAPLHMHIFSLDLLSQGLKKKKHYNSFTTNFFLTAERVEKDLQMNNRVTINQDVIELLKLEKQDMVCVWCGEGFATIGGVKKHLPGCAENKAFL